MPRYRPSELAQIGISPKRGLSQNFLIDQNILDKFIKTARLTKEDTVLEIGPGPGALTEHLLNTGARVIAIEKDPNFADALFELKKLGNLSIFIGDALDHAIEEEPIKIIANLPFNIGTKILTHFVSKTKQVRSLTVLMQKEVAQRVCAKKNDPFYSSLSLFVHAYSTPKIAFPVPSSCFFPKPSVKTCVVHLVTKPFPFPFSTDAFFRFTRQAFGKRRKVLRNSLSDLFDPHQIDEALQTMEKSPSSRPQELSIEEFGVLFQALHP